VVEGVFVLADACHKIGETPLRAGLQELRSCGRLALRKLDAEVTGKLSGRSG
jgi:hypothetical protein